MSYQVIEAVSRKILCNAESIEHAKQVLQQQRRGKQKKLYLINSTTGEILKVKEPKV